MKVHKEVHFGNRLGNPNFRSVPSSITKIWKFFNFSVFLTVQIYFPTNCFQLNQLKLRT